MVNKCIPNKGIHRYRSVNAEAKEAIYFGCKKQNFEVDYSSIMYRSALIDQNMSF